MQKHSATRSTLTAAEARHLLATKASMELFALGISAHTIDMMREVALPLLFATGQLPCTATMLREGGACDDEVRDLKIQLRRTLLAGIPVALFVDGSDTQFIHRARHGPTPPRSVTPCCSPDGWRMTCRVIPCTTPHC